MRKLMLACACAALISGILSVILWRDLRRERELNAALQEQLADERGQRTGFAQPRPPATPTTLPAADSRNSEPTLPQENVAAADAAAAALEADLRFNDQRRKELESPEYRRNFLRRARESVARRYAGLAESLNLTVEEADKVFDILAQREIGQRDASMMVEGLPDEERLAARENAIGDLNQKRDDALAALLGSRLQQFNEYRQFQPGWAEVADLNQLLGSPLQADQSKPLAATLAAEQKRMAEQLRASAGGNLATLNRDPVAQARLLEELGGYQEEANRRTLESASSYLTPRQLEVLRSMLEQRRREMRIDTGPRPVALR
jgi:hypothetical protein